MADRVLHESADKGEAARRLRPRRPQTESRRNDMSKTEAAEAIAARASRTLSTPEAIARLHRDLADQASMAWMHTGSGFDLCVYNSKYDQPYSWSHDIDVGGISTEELAGHREGALKRLPLAAEMLSHAAQAMGLEPDNTEVSLGHLMEALDRVVDTIGTFQVVDEELYSRATGGPADGE